VGMALPVPTQVRREPAGHQIDDPDHRLPRATEVLSAACSGPAGSSRLRGIRYIINLYWKQTGPAIRLRRIQRARQGKAGTGGQRHGSRIY
jgi:hypothetical protein